MILAGCQAKAPSTVTLPPGPTVVAVHAPAPAPVPPAMDGGEPLCHAFGGLIHGRSRCLTLVRATGTTIASDHRIKPGEEGSTSVECTPSQAGGAMTVGPTKLRVACAFTADGSVSVRLTIVDDAERPALRGRRFELGDEGFADFVNVIAEPRGDDLDFSVDFGVLD